MDLTAALEMVLGPLGGLVLALLALWMLLYTRRVVPGYVAEAAETRAEKTEQENERLNKIILELSEDRAGMSERIKSLEKRVAHLTSEITRLRKELGRG